MALLLCPCCARHVRETESSCPFCGAARVAAAREEPVIEGSARLSRAALMLAGALALTSAGCDRSADTRIAQPYGAPPTPSTPDVIAPPSEPVLDASASAEPADASVTATTAMTATSAISAPRRAAAPRAPSLAGGYGAPPSEGTPF